MCCKGKNPILEFRFGGNGGGGAARHAQVMPSGLDQDASLRSIVSTVSPNIEVVIVQTQPA